MSTTLVKKIDHLNISVNNFQESAEWYNLTFGFEKVEEGIQDGKPWGVLKAGDALLCLYEQYNLDTPSPERIQSQGFHYISHFGLKIEDKERWEKYIQENNISILYGGPIEWPHSIAWYIKDPSGWEIEVVYWIKNRIRFN